MRSLREILLLALTYITMNELGLLFLLIAPLAIAALGYFAPILKDKWMRRAWISRGD